MDDIFRNTFAGSKCMQWRWRLRKCVAVSASVLLRWLVLDRLYSDFRKTMRSASSLQRFFLPSPLISHFANAFDFISTSISA